MLSQLFGMLFSPFRNPQIHRNPSQNERHDKKEEKNQLSDSVHLIQLGGMGLNQMGQGVGIVHLLLFMLSALDPETFIKYRKNHK